MITLSKRSYRLSPSPTVSLADAAKKRAAEGKRVLLLIAGEPVFETPDHIKQACKDAIDQGLTKYTPAAGLPDLREALIRTYAGQSGFSSLDHALVTAGGKQSIFNAFSATLDPGDEVLLLAPYWPSYADMARYFGARVTIVDYDPNQSTQQFRRHLVERLTSRTKWVVVNSPSNPSGFVLSYAAYNDLVQCVQENSDAYILSDEIYRDLCYGDTVATGLLDLREADHSRSLMVGGFSKTYCMTGWRIGFSIGPAPLIEAMTALQSQTTTCVNSVAQIGAIKALEVPPIFIGRHVAYYAENLKTCTDILGRSKYLSWIEPQGAFYLLVNYDPGRTDNTYQEPDDFRFCRFLLETHGIAVMPGSPFGAKNSFRISLACSKTDLSIACETICTALEQYRK